jgi:hypothetical protein
MWCWATATDKQIKREVRTTFGKLLGFLKQLDDHHLWYRLEHVRDAVMVMVTVPGERWEIEFFDDGQIEVERFRSSGDIVGEEALDTLIADYGD